MSGQHIVSRNLAGETVNHIGASTADVFHAAVLLLCVVTGDVSSFANEFAIPAVEGVAERESSIFLESAQGFWGFGFGVGVCGVA